MDITITLYSTSDEPNKVEKTLSTNSFVITGKLKEEQDITAPAITIAIPILDTGVPATDIFQWNYAYISQPFKRYYFIAGFDTGLNNLVTIYFKEDYLMSWKTNIYNLIPLVTRQATEYNPILIDSNIPIESKPNVSINQFYFYNKNSSSENEYDKYELVFGSDFCYAVSFLVQPDKSFNLSLNVNTNNEMYRTILLTEEGFVKFFNILMGKSLQELGNLFDTASEYIISVVKYPFNPNKVSKDFGVLKVNPKKENEIWTNKIYVGNMAVIDIGNNYYWDNFPTTMYYFCSEKISISENRQNLIPSFLKYPPYSYRKIMLPYVGSVDLDESLIAGTNSNDLYITYCIDVSTNRCLVMLSNISSLGTDLYPNNILQTFECSIGDEVPWGSTNREELIRNHILLGLNLTSQLALSFAGVPPIPSAAVNTLTKAEKRTQDKRIKRAETLRKRQNEASVVEAGVVYGVLSNTLGEILSSIPPIQGQISGVTSGSFGSYLYLNRIIVYDVTPKPIIPSNYYELYGGPCNLTVPLSTLKDKGFTKCANLHMNGFPNCTLEEINEIEDLLLSGVIL